MAEFTFGSLFAGIGGFDLGFERAGMRCLWQVEIDPFCQKVLAKHWPDVRRYEDVRECGAGNLEPIDLICGGFPCQDLSGASASKTGLGGGRSGLWWEFARIISEIRPCWIVVENVPGLLSINDGRDFGTILRFLAQEGYDAEWACIPASYMGAPHIRERVFVVAYANTINGQEGVGIFKELEPKIFRDCPAECAPIWLQAPLAGDFVDDGISGKLYEQSVGSLGNAVVPQVAEWLGRRIMDIDWWEREHGNG